MRLVFGVDFSCAPTRRKPITVAAMAWSAAAAGDADRLELLDMAALASLSDFSAFLERPGPWLGGFDLPFGQPRSLIEASGWPTDWPDFVEFFGQQPRDALRDRFRRWCQARPIGQKFAWRRVDRLAGSSPAMRWTNPPVAWMMQTGAPLLLAAGLWCPAHQWPRACALEDLPTDARIALEAYPGHLARQITKASYKSDTPAKQTAERRLQRAAIVSALAEDRLGLGLQVKADAAWWSVLVEEGSADLLDALLCAVQAVLAVRTPGFGLPDNLDPLEGWIASVPPPPH